MISAKLQLTRADFHLDVDIQLPAKGVTVFYGHSGSGKTTLLRCIAGLEKSSQGRISFNGEPWQDGNHFVPTYQRPLGYVFQEASLFPHLTAQENLNFAIKRCKTGQGNITLKDTVDLLGIDSVLNHYPAQMSGGERQRVAIARALLVNPQLLLMDEPLAALDVARKQEILPYLEELKQELDLPILYVSHSPDEVARLADHLVALSAGKVVTSGPLVDTLSRLDFPIKLGEDAGVVIEGTVTERDQKWHLVKVSITGGDLWFRDYDYPLEKKVRVRILARDISLALEHQHNSSIINALPAVVTELKPDTHDGLMLVKLDVNNDTLVARVTARSADHLGIEPGKRVWAHIKSVAIVR